MIISKKKFKEIVAKAILETSRQLGKNLSISQRNAVYRSISMGEINRKVKNKNAN